VAQALLDKDSLVVIALAFEEVAEVAPQRLV
jgi:hypothetical protein